MSDLISIILGTIFVSNYVLGQFLGICPALGVTSKVETARGMGFAVIFVITLASLVSWIIQYYLLEPLNIEYLQTVVFILVIASLVQSIESVMKKTMPSLYGALGVFLPLITTNCVVLGVTVLNVQNGYNLIETIFSGFGASVGFTLALVLIAALREKLMLADVPKALQGVPIALVSAGLMAIAFSGFGGLV